MNKSSFLNNKKLEKTNIALICILGMFAGFLVSRALLSVSMFLFGINAIRDIPPRQWLKKKWWLIGAGWVAIYALTWFWSADKGNWGTRLEVKLPFLLLPLAFSFLPSFSQKQTQQFTIVMACMMLLSAFYSISFYITDPASYILAYRQSHILPTLPKEDHIRASTVMALFIVWSVYAWPLLHSKAVRWFTGASMVVIIIFMHVLAAKSGLVSFYIFLVGWGIYLSFARKRIIGIAILVAIPLFYFLAMNCIPTFRERMHYIDYSFFMLKRGDKTGIGDNNRLISYKIALDNIQRHPLTGVGTGDMMTEMTEGYHRLYPQVQQQDILLPHNQFLIVALGCGIPAMLLFAVWVLMPLGLVKRNRASFFFFIVWLILFLQLVIEPVFEVQFGVFAYLFFLLLFRKQLPGHYKTVESLNAAA